MLKQQSFRHQISLGLGSDVIFPLCICKCVPINKSRRKYNFDFVWLISRKRLQKLFVTFNPFVVFKLNCFVLLLTYIHVQCATAHTHKSHSTFKNSLQTCDSRKTRNVNTLGISKHTHDSSVDNVLKSNNYNIQIYKHSKLGLGSINQFAQSHIHTMESFTSSWIINQNCKQYHLTNMWIRVNRTGEQ